MMNRWKCVITGLLLMAVVATGWSLQAQNAPNRIGVRFEQPKIKEGEKVQLTLFLDSPLAGNTNFLLHLAADTSYFPTIQEFTEVTMTTAEQTITLDYISEGRFASQENRFLTATVMPLEYMGLSASAFAVNPNADSAVLTLTDAPTQAFIESATRSSTVTEGTDVYVRVALTGDVALNNSGGTVYFNAAPSGQGWTDTSIITFTLENNERCSNWVKLSTTIGETFGQRSAYLTLDSYYKPNDGREDLMVISDRTPAAFQIVNNITENPIFSFALPATTVREPDYGSTKIYDVELQSLNGIPKAGIKVPFRVSGTAVEGVQYKILDHEFQFDGEHGYAKIRVELLNDDLVRLDRTIIFTLFDDDPLAKYGANQSFVLTIENIGRNTGIETGYAGFGGGVQMEIKKGHVAEMLIAVNGLSNGAVATATFTISGGKYGEDYIVRGATKPGKASTFNIISDVNGWAPFSIVILNNRIPTTKQKKLTVKLTKVKSETQKQKFKLVYKKAVITIQDDNPLVNPANFSMPHIGDKRYTILDVVATATRAAGHLEDSTYLYLNPAENTFYSGLGAEVTVQGNKNIIYNTNTDTFRANVSDLRFQYGVSDSFVCVVRKAGAGGTDVNVTVCIGDCYTRNAYIEAPFDLVNSNAGGVMAATVFSRTPKVYALYYDPYQKLKQGKVQKPKRAALRVEKVTDDDNQSIVAKFTRRIRLYDSKAVKAARKIGHYTVDVQHDVQVPNIGAEIWFSSKETLAKTGKKGKVEAQIAGMILTPPRIDSVTYFQDKQKRTVMKVCGTYFGDKPQVRIEYRHAKGNIRYLKLKELKPTRDNPIALTSLSGEENVFLAAPPAFYANTTAEMYFYLPEVKALPSAVANRYDLYVESEIGLTGAPKIGINTGNDVTMPWNTYFYEYDDIIFRTRTINNISVVECHKDNGYYSKPLVVLAHGYGQSNEGGTPRAIARALAAEGYFVVIPNALGHGDRVNNAQLLPTETALVSADEIAQMLPVYANDPRVDYNRTAIAGASMGGITTYAAIANYPEYFKCAVPFIATPELMGIVYGAYNATWQYSGNDKRTSSQTQIARAAAFNRVANPIDKWKQMKNINLLMLNGAMDSLIPVSGPAQLLEYLAPTTNANVSLRYFDAEDQVVTSEMIAEMLLWFERYLK